MHEADDMVSNTPMEMNDRNDQRLNDLEIKASKTGLTQWHSKPRALQRWS